MPYELPAPVLNGTDRRHESDTRRGVAAANSQPARPTQINGESQEFEPVWPTHFTKGLPHDIYGVVVPDAFVAFSSAINHGNPRFDVPLGPRDAGGAHRPDGYPATDGSVQNYLTIAARQTNKTRRWESPLAGHVFDLQGPDAGSVSMAPAPRLGSDELAAELAEIYAMALLRDVPFREIGAGVRPDVSAALNRMAWFDATRTATDFDGRTLSVTSARRRAARFPGGRGSLAPQTLFRGSSFGCADGPYISQFLLQGCVGRNAAATGTGTPLTAQDGYIVYGAQRIDQRIEARATGSDYMTDWASWLDVQNGADLRGSDTYAKGAPRFITTPRDLATYVHFDALYQPYINACLLLLAAGAAFDSGLPEGHDVPVQSTRDGFATFGGPHILTLVPEVATRALKAVWRQKYNYHCRARPEALAAVVTLTAGEHRAALGTAEPAAIAHLAKLREAIDQTGTALLEQIDRHNAAFAPTPQVPNSASLPDIRGVNHLLPMAFPEGSPMHPSYGSGHAAVGGACVTVLKAFFEIFDGPGLWTPLHLDRVGRDNGSGAPLGHLYVPCDDGSRLDDHGPSSGLTLLGELNKLAANIAIGRNMAGVHYYSDYFDSLRLGERIAVGILLEQMETYPEPVTMRLTSFDGDQIAVRGSGRQGGARLVIADSAGKRVPEQAWWTRHLPPEPPDPTETFSSALRGNGGRRSAASTASSERGRTPPAVE